MRSLAFAIGVAFTTPAFADAVDSAWELCTIIDGANLASEPCEVSGWRTALIVVVDIGGDEAQNLCEQFAQTSADRDLRFESDLWRLQFKSLESGGIIAMCRLPQ